MSKKKRNQKSLSLRSDTGTSFGKVIDYLHNHPTEARALAMFTLEARFLLFTIDRDDPAFKEIATVCANTCQSWVNSIREYADLDKVDTTIVSESNSETNVFNSTAKVDKLEDKEQNQISEETEKLPEKTASGLDFMDEMGIF